MKDKELTDIGQQVAKRGRPKGSGGNTRADLAWSGNENLSHGDMSGFIRQARLTAALNPIDISDIEQVKERLNWYFDRCQETGVKPVVSGMCNALGINRVTLYKWEQGTYRANTHQAVIVKYKRMLEELWEMQMVEGKINPIVGIFLGKNHFGYADKQDIIVTPNNPLGEDIADTEEIRQRYIDSVVCDDFTEDTGNE